MNVLDAFIQGKHPDQSFCEDGYVITEDYAVVIDGAGTPNEIDFDGKKSGRYIMEQVSLLIPKVNPHLTHTEFIKELGDLLCNHYKDRGCYNALLINSNLRPVASMGVYSKHHNEVWLFGDCKALVNGVVEENPKIIDDVTSSARKFMIEASLIAGSSIDDLRQKDSGREYIDSMLHVQRLFLHRTDVEYGFSSFDGYAYNEEEIKVIKVEDPTKPVILTTDGYHSVYDTLAETEMVLKQQLEDDPLCINLLKGTKAWGIGTNSFDDRTYIKVSLHEEN